MEIKRIKIKNLHNTTYKLIVISKEPIFIEKKLGNTFNITSRNIESIKKQLMLDYQNKSYLDLLYNKNNITKKISFQVEDELELILIEDLAHLIINSVRDANCYKNRIEDLKELYREEI